jgi:hypothetical protein
MMVMVSSSTSEPRDSLNSGPPTRHLRARWRTRLKSLRLHSLTLKCLRMVLLAVYLFANLGGIRSPLWARRKSLTRRQGLARRESLQRKQDTPLIALACRVSSRRLPRKCLTEFLHGRIWASSPGFDNSSHKGVCRNFCPGTVAMPRLLTALNLNPPTVDTTRQVLQRG